MMIILKELRTLSWDQLKEGNNANDEAVYGRLPLFRPVVDGWVVPSISPTVMELGSRFAPVPVADDIRFEFMRRFFLSQEAW